MARSGYVEGWDLGTEWDYIRWRGAVKSALRGFRGQAFLQELRASLDALPQKRLIKGELEVQSGDVCALGAVGKRRGLIMDNMDTEDHPALAATFNISPSMTQEIMYLNDDEDSEYEYISPEQRFKRFRAWVEKQILK